MKEVLVSGSHGFIGRNFVEQLHSFDRIDSNSFLAPQTLAEKLKDTKVVVHLGALIQGTEEEQITANVENTRRLLEAISKMDEKPTLVFASTFAVYGVQDDKLQESTVIGPRNAYGRSKAQAERLVEEYARKAGFPALILRFSNVYGPGMEANKHSVVANFIDKAIKGEPLTVNGNGEQRRDFIYIGDVINALSKSVDWKGKPGEVVVLNICSGESVSLNQIIKDIEAISGKPLHVDYPSREVTETGNWIGDNNKARSVLQWRPVTTFKNGLKQTYEEAKS